MLTCLFGNNLPIRKEPLIYKFSTGRQFNSKRFRLPNIARRAFFYKRRIHFCTSIRHHGLIKINKASFSTHITLIKRGYLQWCLLRADKTDHKISNLRSCTYICAYCCTNLCSAMFHTSPMHNYDH